MPRRHLATDTTQFQRAQQNEDGQLTTREHAAAVPKASSAVTRQAQCHDKAGGQSPQASDVAEHKSSQGLMDLAPVHGHFNLRVPVTSQMAAKVKFSEKWGSRKLNVSVVEAALRRSGLTRPLSDYAIVFVPNASMANPVKLDASDGTPAVCVSIHCSSCFQQLRQNSYLCSHCTQTHNIFSCMRGSR